MKQYIIRLLFKVDASGLKKQLQSISKEAARVGAAMAKSMNRAFKTVAKEGSNASKQVVKSLDTVEKKTAKVGKEARSLGKDLGDVFGAVAVGSAIRTSIQNFAKLESGLVKLQSAAQLFGKDFEVIKKGLLDIRKEGVLSFETLNYTARQLVTPAFGIAADQVDDFIKGLRNIAAVEGIYEDLDFAITSFVRGLQTGTAELLENLSPRIRAFIQTEAGGFAKVQKDQAARQKVFNEIFRASTELQGEYERQLATTTIRTNVLNQRLLESSEIVGDLFNPAYENAVVVLSNILKAINSIISPLGTLGKAIVATTIAVGGLAVSLKGLSAALALIGVTLNPLAAGITLVSGALFVFLNSLSRGADEVRAAREEFKRYQKQLKEIEKIDPTKSTLAYAQAQEKLRNSAIRVNKALGEQVGVTAELINLQVEERNRKISNLKADLKLIESQMRMQVKAAQAEGASLFGGMDLSRTPAKALTASSARLENILGSLNFAVRRGGSSVFEATIINQMRSAFNTRRQLEILEAITSEKITPTVGPGGATPLEPLGGSGRSILSFGQTLDRDLEGQLIEIERSFNKSSKALQEFREKALDPTTEEYKLLSETLRNTGISNAEYLKRIEYELEIKKQIAGSTAVVNDRFKELNKDLKETDESLARLSTTAGLVDSFSSALEELDGTLGGLLKSISGISGGISEVLKDLAESRRKSIDEGIKSGDIKSEDIDDLINSVATTKIIGAFIERFSLGVGIFGGVLSGLTSIFSSDVFAAPADDRLFIETIEIKDVGLKQLEILERQYELQRQLAEVESDYYQNNLKALDLIEQKTGESQAQQRFDLAIAELARLQSGMSVAQFERLSESEKEKKIEEAKGVATQEGFESQVKSVKEIGIAAVGSQALLDELSKESPDLFKVFDLFTPELIERFPEIYDYIKRVRTARLTGTTVDEGTGGGGQVTLTPGFFNPGGAGPTTGTTQVIETTDGGTQSLLQAFFGSLSEGLLELQNVNDNSNQILNAINSAITYNNELTGKIAENTTKQVQPRGFGAVDVSRGGLAFGRDFIPTAASLISNVGVPAQIGSLSVAAEANKTMDQKMLDSLQNQLIELKAQTNLLAQLTNTDARIVIANAQQAVKATGF